ncbi:MAG TPA: hypothetical protein VMX13_02060 [Sedimentisphaerales bacterium]|nr:hypothetical protein [Sedimentisphaerales bacterium]
MSLVLSIQKLESMIMVPVEERNVEWAHDICTSSRFVHVNVWRFQPDRKRVRDIIELLERARSELLSILNSGDYDNDRKKFQEYIDNVGARVANLKNNYLTGKPSAFAPHDKISEQRHEVS